MKRLKTFVLFAIVALCAPPARGQQAPAPTQTPLYQGNPTPGDNCIGPYPNGVFIYLTPPGGLTTCAGGTWQSWPFGYFAGPANPVSMSGMDTALYGAVLPPLPASGCFNIDFAVGTGLSNGTIKVLVDSVTIAQPFQTGTVTGVNMIVRALYCNTGTQTAQTWIYLDALGGQQWWSLLAPNSNFPSDGIGPAMNDSSVITPSSVDWSKAHSIQIVVNQPSGNVTPQFLRITGGY
jgi:hypothetical protein